MYSLHRQTPTPLQCKTRYYTKLLRIPNAILKPPHGDRVRSKAGHMLTILSNSILFRNDLNSQQEMFEIEGLFSSQERFCFLPVMPLILK